MSEFGLVPVAVRVLPECADCVRKCLHEGVFYYLNNDYQIESDGTRIQRRSKRIEPVDARFFRIDEKTNLSVNLSAIVGMNGDGKSSLIELIVRLLNNYAFETKRHPEMMLRKADGVRAEFYYQLNGVFYCLRENNGGVGIYCYKRSEDNTYIMNERLIDFESNSELFFTFVSNYSHYAYNTQEVDNYDRSLRDDEHWLHYVFHKNDGYQTPLSLHPFREKGNININRERELSKQRVLMTFVQASLKSNNSTEMSFNSKTAVELKLIERDSSKLQEISLKKYFNDNKGANLLQEDIDFIKQIVISFNYLSETEGSIVWDVVSTMEDLYRSYFQSPWDKRIYKAALDWLERENLLESSSDISELLERLDYLTTNMYNMYDGDFTGRVESLRRKWYPYSKMTLLQLKRIRLIRDIMKYWRDMGVSVSSDERITVYLPQTKIFASYDSLSQEEKCLHYIIYKTLDIFETYPSYDKISLFHNELEGLSNFNFLFDKLSEDWQSASHITLKLRQTYNYIRPGKNNTSTIYGYLSKNRLVFSDLSPEKRQEMTRLENMPPAIFYWDIYFAEQGKRELVPLESFSSGEKQKLFCLAAIVYHLQNISSIGSERYRYDAVNLILEEVELYFHPEWQRTLISDLLNLIYQANIPRIHSINITFVTHSPYILSDIPKTNVLFLKNGLPDYSMQENTFGANLNSLLKNGFFLPALPMGEFANQKIQHLFSILHSGDFDPADLPRIYSEIMTVGEPLIRQQLLMLYNPYRAVNMDGISAKAILQFLKNKLS